MENKKAFFSYKGKVGNLKKALEIYFKFNKK